MTLLDVAKKNVARAWRDYALHFANSVFAITAFFLFMCLAMHPEMGRADLQSTIGIISVSAGMVVAVFSLAFITYSESCFLRTRSRQFGLMSMMGASKRQLRKIVRAENIIIGVAAIVTGALFGTALLKLFLSIAGRAMGTLSFEFYLPIAPAAVTAAVFLAVFLASSAIGARSLSRKDAAQLLDADLKAERKPSVKFAVAFLCVSVAALATGLYMSQGNASFLWSILVIMGGISSLTSGTFLLFYGIVEAIEAAGKSTRSYYEGLSMLKATAFSSTLRGNLQSMTVTAVLCSLSFFALVFLFTLTDDALERTTESIPYPVSYIARGEDVPEAEQSDLIESVLSDRPGYHGETFGFSWADQSRNAVMSESEYNKSAAVVGRQPVDIASGEALLLPGSASAMPTEVPGSITDKLGGLTSRAGDGLVLIDGYASTVTVLDDADYRDAGYGDDEFAVHAYTYDGWESDAGLPAELASLSPYVRTGDISLPLAVEYYEADRVQFSLLLYLGSILSISFLLASASLIYSRMNARSREVGVSFRPIVKIGLSRSGLRKICWSVSLKLLALPLVVSFLYLWAGIVAVNATTDVGILQPAVMSTLVALVLGAACCAAVGTSYSSSVAKVAFSTDTRTAR